MVINITDKEVIEELQSIADSAMEPLVKNIEKMSSMVLSVNYLYTFLPMAIVDYVLSQDIPNDTTTIEVKVPHFNISIHMANVPDTDKDKRGWIFSVTAQ